MRWWLSAVLIGVAGLTCVKGEAEVSMRTDRLESDAAIRRGATLYAEHCAICHGERGDGQGRRGAYLRGALPDFTRPAWGDRMPAARVFVTLRDGRPGTSMPAWAALGDDALTDLTAFVVSRSEERAPASTP